MAHASLAGLARGRALTAFGPGERAREEASPCLCLHVFSSFGIGGVPLRMVRIMNDLGPAFRHLVMGLDGATDAAAFFAGGTEQRVVAPPDRTKPLGLRLLDCARTLRQVGPDLLLTYNWGAIEWALANRLFARAPHLHHEAGFGKEEAVRQLPRRVLLRRLALGAAQQVIVPSHTLEQIALETWRLPRRKVVYLPNGIDVARFAEAAETVGARPLDHPATVGTLAPLRPEKNVGRLIEAFAAAVPRANLRLLIAGEGEERPLLEAKARALGLAERVLFLGQVDRPEAVLASLDIFALSSETEQMPNALLEAMAAGLPVAAVGVGDVRAMVAEPNHPYIVPPRDAGALADALVALAQAGAARRRVGAANLARVRERYSHDAMVDAWRAAIINAARRVPASASVPRQEAARD